MVEESLCLICILCLRIELFLKVNTIYERIYHTKLEKDAYEMSMKPLRRNKMILYE